MIHYKFGEKEFKISFIDFLSISTKDKKLYKKDFADFYALYEFIEMNIKNINHMLFDGYEYFLENGVLHNLHGPAYIRYDEEGLFPGKKIWFYIDGKLVHTNINETRGCKNLEDFRTNEIFHFEKLTNKKSGRDENGKFYRRKDGVDYKIYPINLTKRIRKEKLLRLNDVNR